MFSSSKSAIGKLTLWLLLFISFSTFQPAPLYAASFNLDQTASIIESLSGLIDQLTKLVASVTPERQLALISGASPSSPPPPPVPGRAFYVDSSATGTGDGRSWENAWNNLASINWGILDPGDTIFLKGGTYNEKLDIQASGEGGNPITIRTAQGFGRVLITGGVDFNASKWITLDGSKAPNVDLERTEDIVNNINLEVTNPTGKGIYATAPVGVRVLWAEVHHSGNASSDHGIYFNAFSATPYQAEIAYSHVHHNWQDGISYNQGTRTYGAVAIHHNIVEYNGDDGMSAGSGADVYNNIIRHRDETLGDGHPDGIQTAGGSYLRVYNNVIHDFSNAILEFDLKEGTTGWQIYNNVFYGNPADTRSQRGIEATGRAMGLTGQTIHVSHILIANNTFVDFPNIFGLRIAPRETEVDAIIGTNVVVKNNIFHRIYTKALSGSVVNIGVQGSESDVVFDNNIISGPNAHIRFQGIQYSDPEAFNAATAFDFNSSLVPQFVDYDNQNYHLAASDTSAMDKGADLSDWPSSPNIFKDISGTLRPQGAAWDIGAYEYTGSAPPPTTYTLTISKGTSTGSGTVTGTGINCGADCSETVNSGTTLTLTATPATGSTFSGWSGGGCSGTGICTVTVSSNTTITATFTLIPDTTPPVISSISTSNITSSGATISWTTNEPADTQVEYGLTTAYGSQTTLVTTLLTSHTATLTGLSASTLYHYRVKSKDAAGNLLVSPNFTFTTAPAAGPVLPEVSVTATDATVFEAAADTGRFVISRTGDTTTNLFVNFSLSGPATSGTDYQSISTTVTIPAGTSTAPVTIIPLDDTLVEGDETVVLTLSANPTYTIVSPSSATLTIKDNDSPAPDPDDTFPPLISGIIVGSITGTSALISWTTDELSTSQVGFGLSVPYTAYRSDQTFTTAHTVKLSGLSRHTTYYFAVSSRDVSGNTATSTDQIFKTAAKPGKVKNLSASVGSVRLAWELPDDPDLVSILIFRGAAPVIDPTVLEPFVALSATDIRYTDITVVPDTSYTYTLFTKTIGGVFSDGSPVTITTLPAEPGPEPEPSPTPPPPGGGEGGGDFVPTPTPTPLPTPTQTSPSFLTRSLVIGTRHQEVRHLQRLLNSLGYTVSANGPGSPGNETDFFGKVTEAALRRFQCERFTLCAGAPETTGYGFLGPKTRALLNAETPSLIPTEPLSPAPSLETPPQPTSSGAFTRTLSLGMKGNDIKALQEFLNRQGFKLISSGPGSPGQETSFFGLATRAALIRFQEVYHEEILVPLGLTTGTGIFGPATRRKAVEIASRNVPPF